VIENEEEGQIMYSSI